MTSSSKMKVTGRSIVVTSAAILGFLIGMWLVFGDGGKYIWKDYKKDEEKEDFEYQFYRYSQLDPRPTQTDQTPIIDEIFSKKESKLAKENTEKHKGRNWKTNPSKAEVASRNWLEHTFGVKFPATYPDWLINPETGRKLELDCYNEELGIAIECNGVHHYVWPNWTGCTYEKFLQVVRKDDYKRNLCERKGIIFITVPYNVKNSKIGDFLGTKFEEVGLSFQ